MENPVFFFCKDRSRQFVEWFSVMSVLIRLPLLYVPHDTKCFKCHIYSLGKFWRTEQILFWSSKLLSSSSSVIFLTRLFGVWFSKFPKSKFNEKLSECLSCAASVFQLSLAGTF